MEEIAWQTTCGEAPATKITVSEIFFVTRRGNQNTVDRFHKVGNGKMGAKKR